MISPLLQKRLSIGEILSHGCCFPGKVCTLQPKSIQNVLPCTTWMGIFHGDYCSNTVANYQLPSKPPQDSTWRHHKSGILYRISFRSVSRRDSTFFSIFLPKKPLYKRAIKIIVLC